MRNWENKAGGLPEVWVIATGLLFFVATLNVQARLGETPEQCARRYGQPDSDPATQFQNKHHPLLPGMATFTFRYQGWRLKICYPAPNSGAVAIQYEKENRPGVPAGITREEFDAILRANSNGMQWREAEPPNSGKRRDQMEAMFQRWKGKSFVRNDGAHTRFEEGSWEVILFAAGVDETGLLVPDKNPSVPNF